MRGRAENPPAGSAGFSCKPCISRYGPLAAFRSPIQDSCGRNFREPDTGDDCAPKSSQLNTRSDYATQKHPSCFKSRTMPRPYMFAHGRQRTSRLTALWVDAWHPLRGSIIGRTAKPSPRTIDSCTALPCVTEATQKRLHAVAACIDARARL